MGRISEQRIQLRRDGPGVAWGFRLQGGSDTNTPLSVQRVFSGSPSDGQLQRGDVVVSVDGRSLRGMSPLDAQDLITSTGLVLNLGIQRGGDGGDAYHGSQGPAQSNYIPQNTDTYSSGGSLPRSYGPPSQGGFSPPQAPQQPWASSYQASSNFGAATNSGYASYQHPSQFGSGGPSKGPSSAPNHYSPGGGPSNAQTNGGYNDYHSGGGQTFKSSATVFGGQGHASEGQYAGSGPGPRPHDGGHQTGSGQKLGEEGYYGSEGPSIITQPRNEDDEENYERKSIGNIKQMFNKPDETGPHAVGRIKGGRPRAPMYKPNEDISFNQPQYGPAGVSSAKSSLTPSRPGAVQRGAGGPSSYVPPPVINPNAGGYGKKLYGYSQDSTPAPSRYTGGFVGINELTKAVPQPVPVKKPPGQKKKDFDPAQSSVLRVVQEEEERRKVGGPAPQNNEYDDQPPSHHQQQQQRRGPPGQQQRHPQQQQQRKTGQKWEQQQQQQERPSVLNKTGGPSLQALLERDQAQNPQEDPANNRIQYAPQPQPSHGEYRRPGTSYKPAEHKVKAANVDDYPIPEHLLSGGRGGDKYQGAGYQSSYQPGAGYQSNQPASGYQSHYPQDGGYGGQSYQSSAKFSPGSGSSGAGGFSPRSASGMGGGSGAHGYQYGGPSDYGRGASGPGGGFYPSTSFGADGIPASDF